jgi:hypothetical protein
MININLTYFEDYPAFDDIMSSVKYSAEHAGHTVSIQKSKLRKDSINILFGGHRMRLEKLIDNDIKHVIVYNLEQVKPSTPWMHQNYLHLLKNCQVWDYSVDNINMLNLAGIDNIDLIPIGYTPNIETIKQLQEQEKDIDVLFYGILSQRRVDVLNACMNAGMRVYATEAGKFLTTDERNNLISRSKIVINLPYYDDSTVFEMARASVVLANGGFLLCENTVAKQNLPHDICAGLGWTNYADFVANCQYYIAASEERQKIAAIGYNAIKQIDSTSSIIEAINKYIKNHVEVNPPMTVATKASMQIASTYIPKKMQIGSGKSWKYDWFNVDIEPRWKPDMVFDLNKPFPFDEKIKTWRFGDINITKGHFEHILSEHVFEHVQNLVQAMTTCLDLLCEGGVLEVEVPYDLSHGAWQDPTHVRALNENSWYYYTDWYWYIGWQEYRFDNIAYNFGLNENGKKMLADLSNEENSIQTTLSTPRNVDTFKIYLRKRAVTPEEKQRDIRLFPGYDLSQHECADVEYC